MYTESLYLNGDCSILLKDADLIWKNNCDEILILNQPLPINFSLVFLLIPDQLQTSDALIGTSMTSPKSEEIPLFYLRAPSHEVGRIQCFPSWDIIALTTPYVVEPPPLNPLPGNTYRLLNFTSPNNGLASLLIQAKKSPSIDKNLIKDLYEMRDGPLAP
jgi:hypothetical protein